MPSSIVLRKRPKREWRFEAIYGMVKGHRYWLVSVPAASPLGLGLLLHPTSAITLRFSVHIWCIEWELFA